MDKNRLKTQLDTLEKLCSNRGSTRLRDDEVSQFRGCVQKIYSAIESSQEKNVRDSILKNPSYISAIILALQIMTDRFVLVNLVKIVVEIIGKTNTGRRAGVIVQAGGTQALFHVLLAESRENSPNEDFMILLHQVLYKLGLKDRKVSSKARLCQVLPVTLNLVRQYCGSGQVALLSAPTARNLQTLLQMMRLYCSNQHNSSSLGRNAAVSYVFRIVVSCGKKHTQLLKVALDCLNSLVKSKSNSARAIGQGGVLLLLDLFLDFHKTDSKNRYLGQRKAMLSVLRHLTNLRSGRRSLLEHNGLHLLYEVCEAVKSVTELEPLVTQASQILRRCFPRNRLPVPCWGSVLQCPLPYVASSSADKSRPQPCPVQVNTDMGDGPGHSKFPLDYADDSPVDEDDDLSSADGDANDDLYDMASPDQDALVSPLVAPSSTCPVRRGSLRSSGGGWSKPGSKCSDGGGGEMGASGSEEFRGRGLLDVGERTLEELSRDYDKFFPELVDFPMPVCSPALPDDNIPSPDCKMAGNVSEVRSFSYTAVSGSQMCRTEVENKASRKITAEFVVDSGLNTRLKKSISTPAFPLDQGVRGLGLSERKFGEGDSSSDIAQSGLNKSFNFRSGYCGSSPNHSLRPRQSITKMSPSLPGPGETGPVFSNNSNTISDLRNRKSRSRAGSIGSMSNTNHVSQNAGGSFSGSGESSRTRGSKASPVVGSSSGGRRSSVTGSGRLGSQGSANGSQQAVNSAGSKEEVADGCDGDDLSEHTASYVRISADTHSLGKFTMLGYPDLIGPKSPGQGESFYEKTSVMASTTGKTSAVIVQLQQNKILEDLRRVVDQEDLLDRCVFDLDMLVDKDKSSNSAQQLFNDDEVVLDRVDYTVDHLIFESRFECGNLRKAIQVRQYEYDLVLSPDVNTTHHVQWFYFRLANIEARLPYTFNIINCEKPNSQFNFGMKPVMFSVKDALAGHPFWRRVGTQICYYKNHFARSSQTTGGIPGRSYYTTTFVVEFQNEGDVCYLAYHYPYTYSHLMTDIDLWQKKISKGPFSCDASSLDLEPSVPVTFTTPLLAQRNTTPASSTGGGDSPVPPGIYFRIQTLCHTLLGNPCPVITITAPPKNSQPATIEQFRSRPYIVLTSRVHPGESNASWVMRGTMSSLLSNSFYARALRNTFIFKIVPMLNPDGVINGNHRCSMSGEDLNRRWSDPCSKLHPTIFHTKGIMLYMTKLGKPPLVYCDYHGHSRKKNVFMYGCSPSQSWMTEDTDNPAFIDSKTEDIGFKTLPRLLHNMAPAFCITNCSYIVDKAKESTARVVIWRECRVLRSYTMESTYCGCDQGPYRGLHISTIELEEMGVRFAEALLKIRPRGGEGSGDANGGAVGGTSGGEGVGRRSCAGSLATRDRSKGAGRDEGDDDEGSDFDLEGEDDEADSDGEDWSERSDMENS